MTNLFQRKDEKVIHLVMALLIKVQQNKPKSQQGS